MSYVVLYFSIGFALAILVYLYSCYDYRVNHKQWSWDRYVDTNDTHSAMGGVLFAYPLLILILVFLSLCWCIGYIAECVREYIFKIIDQYFVK